MPKEIFISIIDGQGGGIGKNIVGKLRKLIPKNNVTCKECSITI